MPDNSIPKLSELKISIRKQVLHCFLDQKPHEVSEIAAAVGVSRQTVKKCLSFFMKDNLIIPAGKGHAGESGGKKPTLYALSPVHYLICVTLWNGVFRINLFNLNGELLDRVVLDIPLPESAKTAAENIGQLVTVLMEKNRIDKGHVRGVIVSVPGNVDRKTNRLIFSTQAPQWGFDIPLADYLQPYFDEHTLIIIGTPSKLHSGVYLTDPHFENKRLVVISISHGITGCLIRNGLVLNGAHSLIGEIGHMVVSPSDPERCSCGTHGCLEVMLSPARLQAIILREAVNHPESSLIHPDREPEYNEILSAARAGDALGLLCAEHMAGLLSIVFHNIALVFDPDIVIFAGKEFIGDEHFSRMIFDHIGRFRYHPDTPVPFEVIYDDSDLIERDATGSMLFLRWYVLNDAELLHDPDQSSVAPEQPA